MGFAGQWSHLNVLGPLAAKGRGCGSSTRDPRAGSSSVCQLLRVPVTHAGDPGPRAARAGSFWIGSTPPSGSPFWNHSPAAASLPCPAPPGSRWRSGTEPGPLCAAGKLLPTHGGPSLQASRGSGQPQPPRSHQISYSSPHLPPPEWGAHTWSLPAHRSELAAARLSTPAVC